MRQRTSRPWWRDGVSLLLGLAAVFAVISTIYLGRGPEGVDFYHFWNVPRAVQSQITDNIYSPEGSAEAGQKLYDAAKAS